MLQKIITLVALLSIIAGCATLVLNPAPSEHLPINKGVIPEFFNVPKSAVQMSCPNFTIHENYKSCDFSFVSWQKSGFGANDNVKGKLYIPDMPKSQDGFIIIPSLKDNISSYIFAESLARSGFYAVRLYAGFNPAPERILNEALEKETKEEVVKLTAGFFKSAIKQRVVDIMRLADFLELNYGIKKFHTIGISVGGLVGILYTAVDQRADGLMTIISSASFAEILTDSGQFTPSLSSSLRKLRFLLFEKFGLKRKEVLKILKNELYEVEPITYKNRLGKQTLMVSGALDVLGLVDTIIPYSASYKTWKAFGKPEWVFIGTGHFTAMLSFLPFWIEFPYIHHFIYAAFEPYAVHILFEHFLPLALG